MIDVQDLVKDYGSTRAVDGVSFSVRPGEVVGLLGPNGAGKTTTLRVLAGVLPATAGVVRLAGTDVAEDSLSGRRVLGYLPETNPLYESLGVWECLELVAGLRGLPSAGLRRRIALAAERCGLLSVLSKDVGELSKGYRQRLGLALAIVHDPDILILDEPTSSLDPNQRQEVRDLILSLKQKKTVLVSTHIRSEAQALCDRLLIIHKGRIAAQGTVAELRKQVEEGHSFYVRLAGPAAEIEEALRVLPSAAGVVFEGEPEPGCPSFTLTGAGDPRRDLFELAAQRRWPLMELRRVSASLDDIFRRLTGAS
jgi:ABC-2 type transport system ATP-binding protein